MNDSYTIPGVPLKAVQFRFFIAKKISLGMYVNDLFIMCCIINTGNYKNK